MRGWRIDEAVSITAILRRLTFFLGAVCAAQAHLPVAQARTLDDGRTLTIASASLADNLGGIGVNLSLGSSKSRSKTTQTSDTGAASHLNAGGDITLTATGAGTHSDITVQGSALAAGRNLSLRADDEIRLLAARNTTEQHSAHKNSSASLTASVSQGQGRANGKSLDQLNSKVSAGDTARLASGGDTTLNGAVLEGRRIEADIGGDLEIESLQDTSTYRSTQQSAGGSLSVCIPPLCAGAAPVSGSINASNSKIKSDYASVTEQSALSAGDQGFEVAVAGNTTLTGGAITSTQTAIDQNRNRFTTGASLTLTDLANRADYSASATSLSLGAGFSPTGALVPQGTSAGIGQDGGKAQSTTLAAISGIAGNTAARTGDKETGIAPIFDAQKVQKDIEAQARITQMFGQMAPKAGAEFANSQRDALKNKAKQESNPDKKAELIDEANRWDEGGAYRIALHAAIGGLAGNAQGALGAGAAAAAAPLLDNLQEGIRQSLRQAGAGESVAALAGQLVSGATAAGIGVVLGGNTGAAAGLNVDANNRQLHPSEKQRIKELAKGDPKQEARLTAAACAMVRCADGVLNTDPSYSYLKRLQDAGAAMAAEQIILSGQQNQAGESLFQYGMLDMAGDVWSQNKLGLRFAGAAQGTLGVLGVAGSATLCTSGVGCAVGAVTGTVSVDYAQAGMKQAWTGDTTTTHGEQVLQSLGLSPEAAAYTYAALGMAPVTLEALLAAKATNNAATYNTLARASYSDFTPQGIKVTDEVMATPQAQAMMAELKAGNPGLDEDKVTQYVIEWLRSGTTLPTAAVANSGNALIKMVPKGDGVTPATPFWIAPEQARTLASMSPVQIGQALGLPAAQTAKMLQNGVEYYAITPKPGATPMVFVSDVARTSQGVVKTTPNTMQIIVPNRTLWSDPKPIDPATLR